MTSLSVLIVGAGISGLACARALTDAGADAVVFDRGCRPGGRMSSRTLHGRSVDLGASYFTAEPGTRFGAAVDDWVSRGVARAWTDTFVTIDAAGVRAGRSGPMRYGSPTGLRDVVIDLSDGVAVNQEQAVEHISADRVVGGIRYDAVVLAMPDPQAARVLAEDAAAHSELYGADAWDPTIAVAIGYDDRQWSADLHGAFVNDSPAIGFIADDGDRRGDGAPVLVAHSTPELARKHLDEPDGIIADVVAAASEALSIAASPSWTHAHRWTFAKPIRMHDAPFLLRDGIGVCGDAWGEKSSVGTAWTSGDELGRAIAAELLG